MMTQTIKKLLYPFENKLSSQEEDEDRGPPPLPLVMPVYQGQVEEVKALIADGHDVNAVFEESLTSGYRSRIWKPPEVVQLLIDAGADVNFENKCKTPLLTSLVYENTQGAKILLASDGLSISRSKTGIHPLLAATYADDLDAVSKIIDLKNYSQDSEDILESVTLACKLGHSKIVSLINKNICVDRATCMSCKKNNSGQLVDSKNIDKMFSTQLRSPYKFVSRIGKDDEQGFLGKGGFGSVFLVQEKDSQALFAAKFFVQDDKNKISRWMFEDEERYVRQQFLCYKNPYKIIVYDTFNIRPFVGGGDLNTWLRSGKLFDDSPSSKKAKKKLSELLVRMSKVGYVDDGHTKNFAYDEINEEWVIIDGAQVMFQNNEEFIESLKEGFFRFSSSMCRDCSGDLVNFIKGLPIGNISEKTEL